MRTLRGSLTVGNLLFTMQVPCDKECDRGWIRPSGDVFHQGCREASGETDLVRAGAAIRRYRRLQPGAGLQHLSAKVPNPLARAGYEAAGARASDLRGDVRSR